ncbi:transposase [Methylococcus sp. Mc7]|uniref:IS66 family transposase n=1 Tax=Methylococcus sp. Mc7 TaxID=2860258 RepID=UPI00351D63FC
MRWRAYATAIETFWHTLERHRDDPHEKLRAVVREFLLDWAVILRPLSDPSLPLTNNEAERALRHSVIARRMSHGTRSELGSRAYALLASVIETCRRRGAVVLDFLGSVIAAARKGLALPSLPEMQAVRS